MAYLLKNITELRVHNHERYVTVSLNVFIFFKLTYIKIDFLLLALNSMSFSTCKASYNYYPNQGARLFYYSMLYVRSSEFILVTEVCTL